MRFFTTFVLSAALSIAAIAGATRVSDADVEFLLTSAANDFRQHNKAGTLHFRNVRAGRLPLSEGEINALMCGEFRAAKNEWTPFATIKTDGYEQWNGAQSATFCTSVSAQWDADRDLTEALQSRVDALQK